MTRFCPACGAARAGDAAFCASCGKPFADATAAAPAAPPAYAAPPPASPAPYAPPPQAGGYAPPPPGYAPPPTRGTPGWQRWLLIIVGAIVILGGLARMLQGMGYLPDRGRRSSSASPASQSGLVLRYDWLVGTWAMGSPGAPCGSWIRFNNGGRLTDNAGNTGTWQLTVYGTPNGDLTMNTPATGRVQGRITRIGTDRFRLGTQEWNRVNC